MYMYSRRKKIVLFIIDILVTYVIFSICMKEFIFVTNWEFKYVIWFAVCVGTLMAIIDEGLDWLFWRHLKKVNKKLDKLIEETKELFNNRSFKNNQNTENE